MEGRQAGSKMTTLSVESFCLPTNSHDQVVKALGERVRQSPGSASLRSTQAPLVMPPRNDDGWGAPGRATAFYILEVTTATALERGE